MRRRTRIIKGWWHHCSGVSSADRNAALGARAFKQKGMCHACRSCLLACSCCVKGWVPEREGERRVKVISLPTPARQQGPSHVTQPAIRAHTHTHTSGLRGLVWTRNNSRARAGGASERKDQKKRGKASEAEDDHKRRVGLFPAHVSAPPLLLLRTSKDRICDLAKQTKALFVALGLAYRASCLLGDAV